MEQLQPPGTGWGQGDGREEWDLSFNGPCCCPVGKGCNPLLFPSSAGCRLRVLGPSGTNALCTSLQFQPLPGLKRSPPLGRPGSQRPRAAPPLPSPHRLTFNDGILDEVHLLPENGPELVGEIPCWGRVAAGSGRSGSGGGRMGVPQGRWTTPYPGNTSSPGTADPSSRTQRSPLGPASPGLRAGGGGD